MSFEKKVLSIVSEVSKGSSIFVCGTLYVCCSAKEAAKIETALLDNFKCSIIVTPQRHVDSEFSFDFI